MVNEFNKIGLLQEADIIPAEAIRMYDGYLKIREQKFIKKI